jgi:hypothetical protein
MAPKTFDLRRATRPHHQQRLQIIDDVMQRVTPIEIVSPPSSGYCDSPQRKMNRVRQRSILRHPKRMRPPWQG